MRRRTGLARVLAASFLTAGLVACGPAPSPSPTTQPLVPVTASAAPSPPAAQPSPGASIVSAVGSPAASVSAVPAVGTAPAASASPAPGGGTPLAVTYSSVSGDDLPVWIAYESGLFAQHGLDVSLKLVVGSTNMATLLSGETQIAQGGAGEIISAAASGADPVLVANIAPVYPFILEVAPGIQSADDLRGKTLGVSTVGASDYIATRIVLQKLGLDPDKDVTIVQVGISSARIAALSSGGIQASLIDRSLVPTAEAQGAHPLYDLAKEQIATVDTGVEVEGAWLNAHRDLMQRYVDAIVEAISREKNDEAYSVSILEQYYQSTDAAAMTDVYRAYMATVPSLPYPAVDQFSDAATQLAVLDPRVANVALDGLVDRSFVESAATRGLGQ